ncbi:MAG: SRPBCC domain-containing protein [Leptotrichiaceae bacterium]|nr:SRPBCC domain-containing protein [Leptotrichiaceae bacterium]
MNKIIYINKVLNCPVKEAFKLFSDKDKVKWMTCLDANIDNFNGGKYELFWDLENKEKDSTLGCKILAYKPDEFIAFEWKGPTDLKIMNSAEPLTVVSISFIPMGNKTYIHFLNSGWGNSPEWDKAREYFDRVWNKLFDSLA